MHLFETVLPTFCSVAPSPARLLIMFNKRMSVSRINELSFFSRRPCINKMRNGRLNFILYR